VKIFSPDRILFAQIKTKLKEIQKDAIDLCKTHNLPEDNEFMVIFEINYIIILQF
jgi:hypothetical protein